MKPNKGINCIRVVLVKKGTNKWLSNKLSKVYKYSLIKL